MAINIFEFQEAAENGGKICLQAENPDKVSSSSQSLWRRLRGANSKEKDENKGAVANNPFKVQDGALKAEKKDKPEVAVSDNDKAKHKEFTGHAVSSSKKPPCLPRSPR